MAQILHPSSGEIIETADGSNTILGIVSTGGASLDVKIHSGAATGTRVAGAVASPHLNTQAAVTLPGVGAHLLLPGDEIQLHTAASAGETYDAVITEITTNGADIEIEDVKDPLTFAGVAAVDTGVVADTTLIAQINFSTVDSNEPAADLTGDEIVDIVIRFTPPGFGAGYQEEVTILNQPGFLREEYSVSNDRVVLYFDTTANRDAFVARFDGSTQAQGGASQGTNIDVTIHYHDNDAITHYSFDVDRNFGYASYNSTNVVPFVFDNGTFISAPENKIIYLN